MVRNPTLRVSYSISDDVVSRIKVHSALAANSEQKSQAWEPDDMKFCSVARCDVQTLNPMMDDYPFREVIILDTNSSLRTFL